MSVNTQTDKAVKFIHFKGTKEQWNNAISTATGKWDDAIVFGNIIDENGNIIEKHIYAGKDTKGGQYEYNVIDASIVQKMIDEHKPSAEDIIDLVDQSGNVKVELVDSSLKFVADANKISITEGTDDPSTIVNPQHGDYYVKITNLSENISERTAYIFDSSTEKWVALDGNIDADKVIIKNDIKLAGEYDTIGNMKIGDTVSAGTSVKQLFNNILSKETWPSSLNTTYSFQVSGNIPTLDIYIDNIKTTNTNIEVGSKVDAKSTFGAETAIQEAIAKTFNNGYALDIQGTGFTNASIYRSNLSADIIKDTTTSKLKIEVAGRSVDVSYNDVAECKDIIIKENSNIIKTTQSYITNYSNWDNLVDSSLYAKSNLGNYSEEHKTTISKEDASRLTPISIKQENSVITKNITGYWPIYYGYVNNNTTTVETFTVEYIKNNYQNKLSSFSLPYTVNGSVGIYGIWFAIPNNNSVANVDWIVENADTHAPQNMAPDTKHVVENMTGLNEDVFTDKKTYIVQYWKNAEADSNANKYKISKS